MRLNMIIRIIVILFLFSWWVPWNYLRIIYMIEHDYATYQIWASGGMGAFGFICVGLFLWFGIKLVGTILNAN